MSSSSIVSTSSVLSAFVFLAAMTLVTSLPVATSRENQDQVARALASTAISLKGLQQQAEDTFKVFKATHTNFIPKGDEDMDTHEKYAKVLKEEEMHDRYLPNDFQLLIHPSRSSEENIGELYQKLNTFGEEYRIAVAKIRHIECQLTLSGEACPHQCNPENQGHGMLCQLNDLHHKTRELDNNVKKMMQELSITRQGPETTVPVNVPRIFHLEYYLRVVYELKTTTVRLHNAMEIVQQL